MKTDLVRKATAIAVGGSVSALYVCFLGGFFANQTFFPQTMIEIAVLGSQICRLLSVVSVKRLRHLSSTELFVFFSLEVYIVVLLAITLFLQGSSVGLQWFREVYFSWLSSAAIIVPPYAIFRLASGMYRRIPVSSVLPSAIGQFSFALFLVSVVPASSISSQGLSGLAYSLLNKFAGFMSGGHGPEGTFFAANATVVISSIVIYLALFIYSTLCAQNDNRYVSFFMLIPLFGSTMLLLAWISAATIFTTISLFVITLPAVVLTFVLWWVTRE